MRIRLHTAIGVLGAGFLIAGCGGGGAVAPTPDAAATPAAGADGSLAADATGAVTNSGPTTVPTVGDNFKLTNLKVGATGLKSLFTVKIQPGSATDDSTAATDAPADASDTGASTKTPAPAVVYASAVISLNGQTYTVAKGTMFPKTTQQFTVTSITKSTVVVNLTAGEFSDGSDGITLTKGKTTELVNQSAGIDYKLLLVSTSTKDPTLTPTSSDSAVSSDTLDTAGDATSGTDPTDPTSGDGSNPTTSTDGSSTTSTDGSSLGGSSATSG